MSTRSQDIELKTEIELLLSKSPSVLGALPGTYLNDLRTRLDSITPQQTSYLQQLSNIKKQLFIEYIIGESGSELWRKKLQTEEERKAEEAIIRAANQEQERKAQEDNILRSLNIQQELHRQREESARVNREAKEKQDLIANERAEKLKQAAARNHAAALHAEQLKAQRLATAKQRGFL